VETETGCYAGDDLYMWIMWSNVSCEQLQLLETHW